MRKLLLMSVLTWIILLSLTSCVTPPSFTGFNITDGEYVDPRDDLTISWTVDNPSNVPLSYYVELNGEPLGATTNNSYTISADKLDWGKSYLFKIMGVDDKGNVVIEASVEFLTYAGELTLYVVDANSGPAVEGATVFVNGEEIGQTDENGNVTFMVKENPVEILLEKYGYALSAVKNLVVEGERDYKVLLRKAQLNPDPETQTLPDVSVAFYTDDTKTTTADLDNLTSLYVVVSVDSENLVNIIYAAAGKIPGAGFFGPRLYMPSTNTAEGYVDLSGLEGETEIHIVVYDYNDNRVDVVFQANVIKEGSTEGEKYEILKWSDFGYTNIDVYTRRSEIEFYGLPGNVLEKIGKMNGKGEFFKKFGIKPMTAPEDSNLWVEVWFLDYDLAAYYGFIDTSGVSKPEAYVIYRSFDGINWEKAGVVPETDNYDLVFRDSDPRLAPGKRVFYEVTAYYPDGETDPVYLGYVIPLDVFNVRLASPEDGAADVPRDPTFIWKPTNDAFSVIPDDVDYNGVYYYTLWIYDLVQSENHLLPLTPGSTQVEFDEYGNIANQLLIVAPDAEEVSLNFSDTVWAIISYDFGGVGIYPYSTLEPSKTYEWAVDLAFAYAEFSDDWGNVNSARSIAIDEGYGVDYFGVPGDIHNTFTTGAE